jgi:hypothetical protein
MNTAQGHRTNHHGQDGARRIGSAGLPAGECFALLTGADAGAPSSPPVATASLLESVLSHPSPPWGRLLAEVYAKRGLPTPRLERCPGSAVPQPYRALLVHAADMTPTLENFYQQAVKLRVFRRAVEADSYLREVVLELAVGGRPVEYGVIHIRLDHFPEGARRRILEEGQPLGAILEQEGIAHSSWPQTFFQLKADQHICQALGACVGGGLLEACRPFRDLDADGLPARPTLTGRASDRLEACPTLYGRHNLMLDERHRLLAEVIEILAPYEHVTEY